MRMDEYSEGLPALDPLDRQVTKHVSRRWAMEERKQDVIHLHGVSPGSGRERKITTGLEGWLQPTSFRMKAIKAETTPKSSHQTISTTPRGLS